jgi:WD40 repeat protein
MALLAVVLAHTACGGGDQAPVDPSGVEGLRLDAITPIILVGIVDTAITPTPTVKATNVRGEPVAGLAVTFSRTGNGSISTASTTTGADGTATVGSWRLGNLAGVQVLTASALTVPHVAFSATAQAGPVAQVSRHSGHGQVASPGTKLANPLRARATDVFGNPVGGAQVAFSVVAGGGFIETTSTETDSTGIATSGAWTLGPAEGTHQANAMVAGLAAVFEALACDGCNLTEMVFVHNGQIFRTDLESPPRQLTFDSGLKLHPAWSPDGTRIAYVRDRTVSGLIHSGAELLLMDADGSDVEVLADGLHSPTWSPDGQWLAAAKGDCIYFCEIFVLPIDTAGPAPVQVAAQAAYPAWSPDGSRIAYVGLSGDDGYSTLQLMNVDGSGTTELIPIDNLGSAMLSPDWSPDGSRIAFIRCSGYCNLHSIDATGSALRQLTFTGDASLPSWSADGSRIAFTRWPWGAGSKTASIAIVNSAGGDLPTTIIMSGHDQAWRPISPRP